MLDNIINTVKEQVTKVIRENNDIPAEKEDAAIQTTTSSILENLKDKINPDNISSIIGMMKNHGTATSGNSITDSIQNSVASSLSSKEGIDHGVASKIAAAVIPVLMGIFAKKSNDPDDSFNIGTLISALSGGDKGGNILGKIGGLFNK